MSGKPTVQTRLGGNEADFYTVGYEKLKLEDLFALLRQAGVHCLVDVRDTPWSRVPAYCKNALEDGLAELGSASSYPVKYISMPALGNPRENRESDRSMAEMWTVYRQHVLARNRELEELRELMKNCKAALMCYEADPAECHRSVLATIMTEKYGLTYADLRKG
jgi:uncharacterized protein (DUF488 family)